MHTTRVFIVCSGIGNIKRGFESFFRDCFDALSSEPLVDLTLFKGGGKNENKEIKLFNFPRESKSAIALGKLCGRSGYFIEQITFFISLLPHLIIKKPDLVYVSDIVLANLIRMTKQLIGYQVIYCNGGPIDPKFLNRWDHIQQVSPQHLDVSIAAGIPFEKQTLLPHAIPISESLSTLNKEEKTNLKRKLELPEDRLIILSVGAINKSRKRMDYIVREVANIERDRPFLLMLGQKESETQSIEDLANKLLSPKGFCMRTVVKEQVSDYYKAADVFTLASLDEGFGQVYVEALAHGLLCIVHDYETSRFVLSDMGIYGDLSKDGNLTKLVSTLSKEEFAPEKAIARHQYAYENFSWDKLKSKYVDLFIKCAGKNSETLSK